MKKSFKSVASSGFVPEGRFSKRKIIGVTLILCLIFLAIGAYTGFTLANPSPSESLYGESGIHSGAPTYTVWRESSTYYCKDAFGHIPSWGETSNASLLLQTTVDALTWGGHIFIKRANYILDTTIKILINSIEITGEGDGCLLNYTGSNYAFNITKSDYIKKVILQNFRIAVTDSAEGGIWGEKWMWVTIRDLSIVGEDKTANLYGINLRGGTTEGSFYNHLERLRITAFDIGILLANSTYKPNANTIYGGKIYGVQTGIYIRHGIGNRIIAVTIEDMTDGHGGIHLFDASDTLIDGVYIEDNGDADYGIKLNVSSSIEARTTIVGPKIYNVDTLIWNVNNSPTVTVVGSDFQQSGAAETNSNTSVTFTHGLCGIPTFISASFNSTAFDSYAWNASSTQITITVKTSGTYAVYWFAEYQP